MKKLLIILLTGVLPLAAFTQHNLKKQSLPIVKFDKHIDDPLTDKERNQIIEVYGEYADKYILKDDHRLRAIKQILRYRIVIKEIIEKNTAKTCSKLSEISLFNKYVSNLKRDEYFNPKDFNPLKYNFEFYSNSASIVKIDGTNYYIIIKSQYQ